MASGSMGYKCCLKQCLGDKRNIPSDDPRIEVCTVLPSNFNKTNHSKFLVKWSKRGEGKFHTRCWDSVLKSARVRSIKNSELKYRTNAEKLMVKEAAKTAERHDGSKLIKNEGRRVADMIQSSVCCVAFTGAGISTSAGIGDFRGKSGKWTEDARATVTVDTDYGPPAKKTRTDRQDSESTPSSSDEDSEEEDDGVPYEKLRPTYTHEALHHLMELGHLKYIISQNGDGLHTLSGVPEDNISELHGNVFKEYCEKCHHVYQRNSYVLDDVASQYYEELEDNGQTHLVKPRYAVQCSTCGLCHRTGRKCIQTGCKGYLKDTIINFRDNLEVDILDRATNYAQKSDLMLCLGTTMTVTPACDLVEMGQKPLKLVICNRQKTALDATCLKKDDTSGELHGSRVFGDCDLLMKDVMQCILSQDTLNKWEQQRDERMKNYDKQRKT